MQRKYHQKTENPKFLLRTSQQYFTRFMLENCDFPHESQSINYYFADYQVSYLLYVLPVDYDNYYLYTTCFPVLLGIV